jgi:uncharacterized protein YecE (DUF72 family)
VNDVRVGCSGWSYAHWRGVVYDQGLGQGRWLEHYATLFDTVEVNATFYRLPRRQTVAGWAERTPSGFVFAVKASRYLTHVKRLTDMERGVERLMACVEPLDEAGKLGPVLWQLPETFHRDDDRLAGAIGTLPPGRHAFEFRHPSWFVPEVEGLLREHDVALAVGDHPARGFQTRSVTAGFTFVRFHHGRDKNGRYTQRQLAEYADWLREVRARADVYAYFNNDWQGLSVENATELLERLG